MPDESHLSIIFWVYLGASCQLHACTPKPNDHRWGLELQPSSISKAFSSSFPRPSFSSNTNTQPQCVLNHMWWGHHNFFSSTKSWETILWSSTTDCTLTSKCNQELATRGQNLEGAWRLLNMCLTSCQEYRDSSYFTSRRTKRPVATIHTSREPPTRLPGGPSYYFFREAEQCATPIIGELFCQSTDTSAQNCRGLSDNTAHQCPDHSTTQVKSFPH